MSFLPLTQPWHRLSVPARMRRLKVLLATVISAASLAACGFGGSGDDPVTADDRRVGAEQHPQLLGEFGGSYDSDEAAYLKRVGEQIASQADLADECTFTLVNSDVVNAFAVPGCYIYVTRGLMSLVNSEDELASVLAHELGHIVGKHSRKQQRRSVLRSLGILAIGLVSGSERLTQVAGQAATYFTLRYSRTHEHEADDLGLSYLRKAGYDPHAAADMLAALGRQESFMARTRGRDEAKSIPEWGRTHPLTENRIARAREAAAAGGLGPDELPEKEVPFLRALDGILYGDDPAQGFVLGRRFVHPVMRVAFEAPEGFTLTNSPQAILLEGPDGLRGEFSGGRVPVGGLESYVSALLEQVLGDAAADVGPIQRREVNGLPSLVVPVLVATQQGSVAITIAAYAGPGGGAYHFLLVSQPSSPGNRLLDDLFSSFRIVSSEEAASLRPRRIEVVRAKPGDTAPALAARMAVDDKLGHFLMLNGRSADQPLRPGELVKIVSYSPR